MCLWAIYIVPGSVYIFPPIVGIYNSLTGTWMWKLGLRPSYSFSGNICFKFSAFCLCSAPLPQSPVSTCNQELKLRGLVWERSLRCLCSTANLTLSQNCALKTEGFGFCCVPFSFSVQWSPDLLIVLENYKILSSEFGLEAARPRSFRPLMDFALNCNRLDRIHLSPLSINMWRHLRFSCSLQSLAKRPSREDEELASSLDWWRFQATRQRAPVQEILESYW